MGADLSDKNTDVALAFVQQVAPSLETVDTPVTAVAKPSWHKIIIYEPAHSFSVELKLHYILKT